jgi:hypothetical protein
MTAALILTAPAVSKSQGPASRAFRTMEVQSISGGWDLDLQFEFGVRYVRHTPSSNGKTLRIRVDPVDPGLLNRLTRSTREILPESRSRSVPITEVAYDSTAQRETFVEIQFSRPLAFDVKQGTNLRSIVIHVRDIAAPSSKSAATPRPVPSPSTSSSASPSSTGTSKSAQLLERGKDAVTDGNLDLAISLFTKVLDSPESESTKEMRQEAQELIGLAHERSGQEAHARADYEAYLSRYPEGPAAARVRQRLEALTTAADAPRPALKRATTRVDDSMPRSRTKKLWGLDALVGKPLDYDLFGSLGVTYFRAESILLEEDENPGFLASNVLGDVDLGGRIDADDWQVRGDFTGTYSGDVGLDGRAQNRSDDVRVSRLTLAFEDRLRGYELTLGRQRLSDGGVLGRFDGLSGKYRIGPHYEVSAVVGLPVTSISDSKPNTDTIMAGAAMSVDNLWLKGLHGQIFVVGQNTLSMTDRTAIGGELRYLNETSYSFFFMDYDVVFNSLNAAMLSSTYFLNPDTDLRILVERRNSPVVTLATALQGQLGASSLDSLKDFLSADEIRDEALDRTLTYWTGSIGATHRPISWLQLSGDFSIFYSEGTRPGMSVATPIFPTLEIPEIDPSGPNYNSSVQFLVSDWIVDGGVGSVSLRYNEGDRSRSAGVSLYSRFTAMKDLRISPRLRWDWRDSDSRGGSSILRPSIKADYRLYSFTLDLEAGIQWLTPIGVKGLTPATDDTSYFVQAGLRWEFRALP